MKTIKTRIQNLENSLFPKKYSLLEMMKIASGEMPRDRTYVESKPQTRKELESQINKPGLIGKMAKASLRLMKFREENGY